MKPTINLSRDGKLIQIFIPARLGRHSGRKTILSPTGQPVNPDRNTEADATLINALVRAHRWNRWLASGKYESDERAGWDEGDWTGDLRFGSSDLVAAFQDGGYEQGPRINPEMVPEPSGLVLLAMGLLMICRRRK